MSKIKTGRLLSSVLAVLLFLNPVVFAAEPQDIIDASQMTPQQINYQTTEVERGSFIKEISTPATKYYPLTYNIRFEQDNAKFVEYMVTLGDTVKAGDILAKFSISGSESEFARMELNLRRTEEQTAAGVREREQAIAQKRAEIAELSEEIAKLKEEAAESTPMVIEECNEVVVLSDEPGGDNGEPGDDNGETGGDNGESGGDNDEPGGDNGESGGDNDEPGGDNGEPGGDNGETGGDNGESGGDNGEPGGDNGEPGDDNGEPGGDNGEPGDDNGEPGGDNGETGDDNGEPGGDNGEPGDDNGVTDETTIQIYEYELKILELSLKKMEIELKQYKNRQQYNLDRQREAYYEESTRRNTDILVSPVDGVVSELAYKKVDDAVSPNETLIVVSSGDVMLLGVSNETGELRYNMPVEVKVGTSQNLLTLTGRIVAADDAIPEEERTGYAFVQLDPYEGGEDILRNPKVSSQIVRLDNVLLIDRKAATLEGGKNFVTKLTDGMVQKRYIELGMNNNDSVWVLAGVEEGETLILD